MFFCKNCNLLNNESFCTKCGAKNLPLPTDTDFCFFVEIDNFNGKMFEQALKNNNVKYAIIPKRTGVGYGAFSKESEYHLIYVTFKNYNLATEIYNEIFNK